MKTIYSFILVLTTSTFLSCDLLIDTKKEKVTPTKTLVILIKDRSTSIQSTEKVHTAEQRIVKQTLQKHVKAHTDIALVQINAYSADHTNTDWIHYVAPKQPNNNRVRSEKEEALQENLYKGKVQRVLKKMIRKSMNTLYKKNYAKSNQTAILEVLSPINELSKNYDKVHLIFISDMIQESPLRNFTSQKWPMPSKAYATSLAQKDGTLLTQRKLEIELSKVITIKVIVPENTNPANLVNMPFYWQELFKSKGYLKNISWEKVRT